MEGLRTWGFVVFGKLFLDSARVTANSETMMRECIPGLGMINALPTSDHANSPETGFWDVWICAPFHLAV
jgi:hypothetical protein